MTSAPPTFSVILPTFNRSATVERTLRHLAAQDYPSDRYEVIVVDNSTDETPSMVERLASEVGCSVRLLHGPERLPAVKRNLGLRAAAGDLIVYLNDDVWVVPEFLTEHARTHLQNPNEPVAVLGHVEQSPDMPPTPFVDWFVPFDYLSVARASSAPLSWIYFWTMNISLPRRTMLDRNLVFHEDWAEIGEEDVELGYRWTKAGYRLLYNPRASGAHYHPHTLASASRLLESIGRGVRDLEVLVPDPVVLERWGIFSWRHRPSRVLRGLAREAVFNRITVPLAERWLNGLELNNQLSRWMYWKILMHYANRGYRSAPSRSPIPLPIQPSVVSGPT